MSSTFRKKGSMNSSIRDFGIRVLVVSIIFLFGFVVFLDLFEHPIEVLVLAVPLLLFQFLILSARSTQGILISGIITVIVLLIEILINIFYYHFFD